MKYKIAFIASYPQSLISFRLDLMKEFLARGYEVVAIAPYDNKVAATLNDLQIKYLSVPLERNGINPFSDVILLYKLWRVLRIEQPSLVFSYTIKPIIYGSLAAKMAAVPQIYSMITGTGYVFLGNNFKSKVIGFIARKMFKIAFYFNKRIFFQNKDNLELFRQQKIISFTKPATVINGSGVDCHYFLPTDYPKDISFLMIARFLYDKGVREYVQAARMIKTRYPLAKFQLAGWIDTNPNSITQQELDEWVNEGCIEYLGKLADVRSAISSSSVYVLPSYHEGTPRTVLEAMAMARPIITTDAPGCKETVIPNKNGFLVPVKSVSELYSAMEYFILSPQAIQSMGQESRNMVIDKYDVNKVNNSILSAMQV